MTLLAAAENRLVTSFSSLIFRLFYFDIFTSSRRVSLSLEVFILKPSFLFTHLLISTSLHSSRQVKKVLCNNNVHSVPLNVSFSRTEGYLVSLGVPQCHTDHHAVPLNVSFSRTEGYLVSLGVRQCHNDQHAVPLNVSFSRTEGYLVSLGEPQCHALITMLFP